MQKKQIMFLFLIATMMFGACTNTNYCPSDWYCEAIDICPNGKTVYSCVSPSLTSGGYRVGNNCYLCEDINNIDYGGCSSAVQRAKNDCLSSYASTADSNSPLQEKVIDKYTDSENSGAVLMDADEMLTKLKEAFESFKE